MLFSVLLAHATFELVLIEQEAIESLTCCFNVGCTAMSVAACQLKLKMWESALECANLARLF